MPRRIAPGAKARRVTGAIQVDGACAGCRRQVQWPTVDAQYQCGACHECGKLAHTGFSGKIKRGAVHAGLHLCHTRLLARATCQNHTHTRFHCQRIGHFRQRSFSQCLAHPPVPG